MNENETLSSRAAYNALDDLIDEARRVAFHGEAEEWGDIIRDRLLQLENELIRAEAALRYSEGERNRLLNSMEGK